MSSKYTVSNVYGISGESNHRTPEAACKAARKREGDGWIVTDDGGDVFVHHNDIQAEGFKSLAEGEAVTFDVVQGDKGPRATNVVKA